MDFANLPHDDILLNHTTFTWADRIIPIIENRWFSRKDTWKMLHAVIHGSCKQLSLETNPCQIWRRSNEVKKVTNKSIDDSWNHFSIRSCSVDPCQLLPSQRAQTAPGTWHGSEQAGQVEEGLLGTNSRHEAEGEELFRQQPDVGRRAIPRRTGQHSRTDRRVFAGGKKRGGIGFCFKYSAVCCRKTIFSLFLPLEKRTIGSKAFFFHFPKQSNLRTGSMAPTILHFPFCWPPPENFEAVRFSCSFECAGGFRQSWTLKNTLVGQLNCVKIFHEALRKGFLSWEFAEGPCSFDPTPEALFSAPWHPLIVLHQSRRASRVTWSELIRRKRLA